MSSTLYASRFGASSLEHLGDPAIAALPGKGERAHALPIGEIEVGAAVDEGLDRRLMPRAAVAQYDGFDERRPAEVVDVVERGLAGDQRGYHLGVAQMRG